MSLGLTCLQRGFSSLPGKSNAKECKKNTLRRAPLGVEAVLGGWVRSGCVLKSAWQEHSQELRSMLLG